MVIKISGRKPARRLGLFVCGTYGTYGTMIIKDTTGQRGKAAEKAIEGVLKKWNDKANFAYWRLPDSRSARSYLAAQPGDFVYFADPYAGIIEVKETSHPVRISKDKISQLPNLHKLSLAGAHSVVVVHHSATKLWRAIHPHQLPFGAASWDLSGFTTFETAEAALISTGLF